MVQEFLVQAEEEVEEEMAEDLSAGELQEKLKRLESLQELRLCNEDKVTTIERSAESEEVKKALEKNPDISKERSNLLQGGDTHTPSPMHSSPCTSIILPLSILTHIHMHTSPPTPHTHLPTPPPTPHTHAHTHYPHSSHTPPPAPHTPHRLVSCHIFTEGQDRGDEEESQDGARPGGRPAHQQ